MSYQGKKLFLLRAGVVNVMSMYAEVDGSDRDLRAVEYNYYLIEADEICAKNNW